jgi:hypothetical protein
VTDYYGVRELCIPELLFFTFAEIYGSSVTRLTNGIYSTRDAGLGAGLLTRKGKATPEMTDVWEVASIPKNSLLTLVHTAWIFIEVIPHLPHGHGHGDSAQR